MACVTLKRPHHALSEHPFEPASPSPSGSCGPASFVPSPSAHRPPASKRRRYAQSREDSRDRYEAALLRRQTQSCSSFTVSSSAFTSAASPAAAPTPSVFRETPLTPTEIANNLRDELKRLKHRRQMPGQQNGGGGGHSPPSSPEPMMDDAAAMRTASLAIAGGHSQGTGKEGKPIFTLKQMTLICERMCKERTDHVRAEYEKILQQKLGEQYDAFVKFIDHQIQQRFNQAQPPSYLS